MILLLLIGFILRIYQLSELMPFIGDYGWFYISARDMLINGTIPLVGIASSHPWLHQGPLWTYMLALVLWIFKFSPIGGAYLSVFIGMLTIWVVFRFTLELFSKRAAYIAALLYATSPLAIIYSRIPYHTGPISFLTLLYIYALYKWIKGKTKYFPFAILLLSVLYNFELSTAILSLILLILIGFGILKRKKWVIKLWNKKIMVSSFLGFFIPLTPFLIYDTTHGYPQTVKFVAWIVYKIIGIIVPVSPLASSSYKELFSFLGIYLQRLVFLNDVVVAFFIIVVSLTWFLSTLYRQLKDDNLQHSYVIVFVWISVSIGGYIINKTTSEAYLPILIPVFIIIIAISFDWLLQTTRFAIIAIFFLACLVCINVKILLDNKYLMMPSGGYGYPLSQRLIVAERIVKESFGKEYTITGKGPGSKFESFTKNYEYLTWWLGHGPSKSKQSLVFVILENEDGIILKKIISND